MKTLSQLLYYRMNEDDISEGTQAIYKRIYTNVSEYGGSSIDILGSDWIKGYINFLIKHGYENDTIEHEITKINAVLNWYEYPIHFRIAKVFPSKKYPRKPDDTLILTIDEVDALESQVKNRKDRMDIDGFIVSYFTGMRYSEVKGISVDDIRTMNNLHTNESFPVLQYISGKNGQINMVPVNNRVEAILRRYEQISLSANNVINARLKRLGERSKCFQETVKRIRYSGTRQIERLVPKHQLITFHSARHSYSAMMSNSGMNIESIQGLLNHKSRQTTEKHYNHQNKVKAMYQALEILNK